MSGRIKKDSRYRTVVREYGKVWVTWFGANFRQPADSKLKVGSEVELLAGSTLAVAVIRHKEAATLGLADEVWHFHGIVGGPKNRETVERDWLKIQAELGNPHPVLPHSTKVRLATKVEPLQGLAPESPQASSPEVIILEPPASLTGTVGLSERRKTKQDKEIDDVRELAELHGYLGIGQRLEVQFGKEDEAGAFRLTMARKGYKVADQVHDTTNGRKGVDVFLNVKPR